MSDSTIDVGSSASVSPTFIQLPYRLILDILREYFDLEVRLSECHPTMRNVTEFHDGGERDNLKKTQRDFFGFFASDRTRTVFSLFWSLELYSFPGMPSSECAKRLPRILKNVEFVSLNPSNDVGLLEYVVSMCSKSTGGIRRLMFTNRDAPFIRLLQMPIPGAPKTPEPVTSLLFDSECDSLRFLDIPLPDYSRMIMGCYDRFGVVGNRPSAMQCFANTLRKLNPRCVLRMYRWNHPRDLSFSETIERALEIVQFNIKRVQEAFEDRFGKDIQERLGKMKPLVVCQV